MSIRKIIVSFCVLICAVCVGVVWFFLATLDLDERKDDIKSFFEQGELHTEIYGSIKPSFFPIPHITVNSVQISSKENINNQIRIGELDLYPKLATLFSFKEWSDFRKVEVRKAEIKLDSIADLNTVALFKQISMPTLLLEEASLSIGEKCADCILLSNLLIEMGQDNTLSKLEGVFENNGISYNIGVELNKISGKDINSINMFLKNHSFQWLVEGEMQGRLDAIYEAVFKGSSKFQITNFRDFVQNIKQISFDSYDQISHSEISVIKEFSASLNSDISMDHGLVYFKDLIASAQNISFKPKLILDLLENEVSLDVSIEQLPLNNFLYLNKEKDPAVFLDSVIDYLQHESAIKITDFFTLFFDIGIKRIDLNDTTQIEDLVLSGDVIDGNLDINKGSIKLPGSSIIEISGVTSRNSMRKKFDANLTVSIEDFKSLSTHLFESKRNVPEAIFLKTNFSILPHRIRFSKFRAAIEELLMIGNFSILNDAQDRKSAVGSIRFNKINLDKFGIDQSFDDFIFLLFKSDSDKTGKTYFKLLNDYKWLRYLDFSLDANVIADKLIFKQQEFDHFFASFSVMPSTINVNDISMDSQMLNLGGNFSLSLPGFKPKIQSSLHLRKLDTKIFNLLLPSKASLLTRMFPDKEIRASDKDRINLFSINNFDGVIAVKADHVIHNDQTIKNAKLDLNVANGIIIIKNLEAGIFDGSLKLVGSISAVETVSPMTIGFALNNINPMALLKNVTGIDKLDGYMSISGSASTSGIDLSTAKRMLQAKIMLAGKNLFWNGFDLDKIINATDPGLSSNDRAKYLDYYTKNGKSFFKEFSGILTVKNAIADLENAKFLGSRTSGAMVARYDIMNNMASVASRFSFIPTGYTTPLFLQVQSSGPADKLKASFDLTQLTDFINRVFSTASTPPVNKSSPKPQNPRSIRDVTQEND